MPAYESFAAAMEAQEIYVAALPGWVQTWMNWMMFAFLSAIWFVVPHREARWALLVILLTALLSLLVGYLFGWSRLWSAVHLVVWTPFVVYLLRRRPSPISGSGFAVWANLLLGTMIISLIFDVIDVVRYLASAI